MDKFEKMSIYAIDWKSVDNDGVEQVFTFKPLSFKFYPRTYDLIAKLSNLEISSSLSDTEANKEMANKINSDVVSELIALEKEMVRNSYPELSEERVELFVMSNTFTLIEPLMSLINRQEVISPRHVQAALK